MDIKLSGKVVQILNEQGGEGKNGPWRKRDFILEIPGKYPRKVCITQWGDQIDKNPVEQGAVVTVSVDIQSREYRGNWYTDVKAWRVERAEDSRPEPPPSLSDDDYHLGEFPDEEEYPF
ncbi:MAG TPA: DUF3127 domain-containing protein [Balneolaceae bacterium]|nr:DUF3127 domain-containing protein [Balneolaceae bacterium]